MWRSTPSRTSGQRTIASTAGAISRRLLEVSEVVVRRRHQDTRDQVDEAEQVDPQQAHRCALPSVQKMETAAASAGARRLGIVDSHDPEKASQACDSASGGAGLLPWPVHPRRWFSGGGG